MDDWTHKGHEHSLCVSVCVCIYLFLELPRPTHPPTPRRGEEKRREEKKKKKMMMASSSLLRRRALLSSLSTISARNNQTFSSIAQLLFPLGTETPSSYYNYYYRSHHHLGSIARFSSSSSYQQSSSSALDIIIDLSNEESKRRIFNRLLYRSKQRGFLELDLVLGKWVEQHIFTMDESRIKALITVLDLENPDLWKWLSGQEEPPEALNSNSVFCDVRDKVLSNLNNHSSPETRATPGKPWVRGWDDLKRGRDTPITGNQ